MQYDWLLTTPPSFVWERTLTLRQEVTLTWTKLIKLFLRLIFIAPQCNEMQQNRACLSKKLRRRIPSVPLERSGKSPGCPRNGHAPDKAFLFAVLATRHCCRPFQQFMAWPNQCPVFYVTMLCNSNPFLVLFVSPITQWDMGSVLCSPGGLLHSLLSRGCGFTTEHPQEQT